MSVVARQGFKYSLIGYFGFLLGAVATYLLFPQNFDFYGRLGLVLSYAMILTPVVVFGVSFSNVKFHEIAKKDNKHQNLLSLSLVFVLGNYLFCLALFFLFFFVFPQYRDSKMWNLKQFILPLVLLLSLSAIFNKYISNFKRIVVPNIFENIFPKMANIIAFILFFYFGFSESASFLFFLGIFVLALIGYYIYANSLEKITWNYNLDFLKKEKLYKDIFNYSFYGFLGNIGYFIAIKIDTIMISEHYVNDKETGIYLTLYAIVALISIPQLGLFNISAPIINKSFAENNMEELDRFHKKTSLSLFFLGAVLFSCILVGFPFLTVYIKNGDLLLESEPVIWIIGSAVLIDLLTGFNGNIISMSKYYRFNIVIMVALAFLTVLLNFYFLKNTTLGIIGIAIATAISLTLYNSVKLLFNYIKFKVHPLTIELIYTSLICTIAITIVLFLPIFENNFINLIYKPAVLLMIIFVGNYFLKIYPLDQYLNIKFIKNMLKF
ncbi:lipopolysaccharide biosynthesis protein [Frigoriflavimonas asaccharolytica]|uniref:O-antigen/teichoic acid export membrane protein n=1 Tax=Frigoriflavimonas asaccharolytica TaxID=2735899 RepID=A0A8J8G6W6_9FLAO|nr:polysaccharide biosynthesis protein [Frigoriflavimonas asaccharolytica]NRS92364.1 O-antigen/teichoic acid export membrane protein [Frigoriflavimonas asaccharolytica]